MVYIIVKCEKKKTKSGWAGDRGGETYFAKYFGGTRNYS